MPWTPELFSAPVLERLEAKRRRSLAAVPYFDGLMAGEPDALVGSFASVPVLHDPIRGRIMGGPAFETYVSRMGVWLDDPAVSVEDVGHVMTERHGFEEAVLHFDGARGRVDLPVSIVADRRSDGRIEELRVYFSNWAISGRHANRPPLLQPEAKPPETEGVVGEYQRALAAGDVDAIVATFEPDGYAREPAGGSHVHVGSDRLRSFYAQLFSNGGGIPLEHCGVIDDGSACVLEYNVVRWGSTELLPQAGVAVYARGANGKLAAARIYDDTDPPLSPPGD